MALPQSAIELERRACYPGAEPTLYAAFTVLLDEWRRGMREREVALHLAFLAWYLLIEPAHLTGLRTEEMDADALSSVFNDVHDTLAPWELDDAEVLYVFGLMANIAPWLLGSTDLWEARSAKYRLRYRWHCPTGLSPSHFAGRGFYGEYFEGQAGVQGGY